MYFATMSDSQDELSSAVAMVKKVIGVRQPVVGLILGSGLGVIAEAVEDQVVIPYEAIPGFHVSKVEGHAGHLVVGRMGAKTVLIMQGRFHYYEGVSMEKIAFPIHLMNELGVKSVIITSASGGVNLQFKKGDIMVLEDHINFVFRNPFCHVSSPIGIDSSTGHDAEYGHLPRVHNIYCRHLRQLAINVARDAHIELKRGVYLMVQGPCYETPAEVRMVRKLGGDVVGMSTVPEALAAKSKNLSVLGITYVSNMASGLAPGPLVHSHVIETMDMIRDDMMKLISGIIKGI